MYPPVDMVFSSPMIRCIQTAKFIYPDHKPQLEPNLRERDFGRFDGLSHQEITSIPGYSRWGMTADSMVFPEGESLEEMDFRCKTAYFILVNAMDTGRVGYAAVLCHGGTMMSIMGQFVDVQQERHLWICPPGHGYVLSVDPKSKASSLVRRIEN